jgi:hypothetical protein
VETSYEGREGEGFYIAEQNTGKWGTVAICGCTEELSSYSPVAKAYVRISELL